MLIVGAVLAISLGTWVADRVDGRPLRSLVRLEWRRGNEAGIRRDVSS